MPGVITALSRSTIDAPVELAWSVLGDYANDVQWRHGLRRMEQRPHGQVVEGALVTEELVVMGRTVVSDVVVHDVEPGRSFSWRVGDGSSARGTRRLIPIDAGRCELVLEKRLELTGFDRLLLPIVSSVVRRTEQRDADAAAALVSRAASAGR